MQHCEVGQIVSLAKGNGTCFLVMGFDREATVYLYPLYRPLCYQFIDNTMKQLEFLNKTLSDEVEKLLQGKMLYDLKKVSLIDSSCLIEEENVFKNMYFYLSVDKDKIISFYLKNRMLYKSLPVLETDIDRILKNIKCAFQSKPLESIDGFVKYGIYSNNRSTIMFLGYNEYTKQVYFYNLHKGKTRSIDANISARKIKSLYYNGFFMKSENLQYVFENQDKIRALALQRGLRID